MCLEDQTMSLQARNHLLGPKQTQKHDGDTNQYLDNTYARRNNYVCQTQPRVGGTSPQVDETKRQVCGNQLCIGKTQPHVSNT